MLPHLSGLILEANDDNNRAWTSRVFKQIEDGILNMRNHSMSVEFSLAWFN